MRTHVRHLSSYTDPLSPPRSVRGGARARHSRRASPARSRRHGRTPLRARRHLLEPRSRPPPRRLRASPGARGRAVAGARRGPRTPRGPGGDATAPSPPG
ncbi:MAG: hypothetical protein AVDCRST_MAG45-736 [uncultured Solirubrobacterales bacterium]|uniref:Uncharacterized protein n=1 Tax=uncultured Solirubrobacterales bacterium TaxID=768556 RepID=A0A6J4SDJ0_9ACTN|nr:MAG: hypothetical protein AVDCRST_MAG45-736 [uncultured Solirubrobacterales bacterium]